MKECENGHVYDETRFASCPYCQQGVSGAPAPRKMKPAVKWAIVGVGTLLVAGLIILLIALLGKNQGAAGTLGGYEPPAVTNTPDGSSGGWPALEGLLGSADSTAAPEPDTAAPAPTATPAPTLPPAAFEGITYDLDDLNASLTLPADYSTTDNRTFSNAAGDRVLEIDFMLDIVGKPIHSVEDIEANEDAIMAAVAEQFGADEYVVDTTGYVTINGRLGYAMLFHMTNDGDTDVVDIDLTTVEGDNGFGCYMMMGATLNSGVEAWQEIADIMETLTVHGPANVPYAVYENREANIYFLYEPELVEEIELVYNDVYGVEVPCVLLYPVAERGLEYVEVNYMGGCMNTADEVIEYLSDAWTVLNVDLSQVAEETVYNVTWKARMFYMEDMEFFFAAAEIDGLPYALGYNLQEDLLEDGRDIAEMVMATLSPVTD